DLQDFRTRLNAFLPSGTAGRKATDDRWHFLHAQSISDRAKNYGEDQIHDHTGRDDRHPGRHRLRRVASGVEHHRIALDRFRRDEALGRGMLLDKLGAGGFGLGIPWIIILAEHLDVAAKRQAANAVLRFAPLELYERTGNLPLGKWDRDLEEIEADIE